MITKQQRSSAVKHCIQTHFLVFISKPVQNHRRAALLQSSVGQTSPHWLISKRMRSWGDDVIPMCLWVCKRTRQIESMCVPVGVRIHILLCCILLSGARLKAGPRLWPSSPLTSNITAINQQNFSTAAEHASHLLINLHPQFSCRMVQVNYSPKQGICKFPTHPISDATPISD